MNFFLEKDWNVTQERIEYFIIPFSLCITRRIYFSKEFYVVFNKVKHSTSYICLSITFRLHTISSQQEIQYSTSSSFLSLPSHVKNETWCILLITTLHIKCTQLHAHVLNAPRWEKANKDIRSGMILLSMKRRKNVDDKKKHFKGDRSFQF